ncbi:MAG: hypothetical protein M1541_12080 [Acidobacteria bacterium]|nr:hypothetical protein [Acidobacteriota bacterium]
MPKAAFGNDPGKIGRYRAFWNRAEAKRPLVGFSLVGWFPVQEFTAARAWSTDGYLTPAMVDPDAFLEDHLRMLREGDVVDDDVIRGACPAQVAIPWLPAMLGCPLRILPESVLGEDRHLSWREALATRLERSHPWFEKYLDFVAVLVRASEGRFPVSHSAEIGPTDLHAVLRGHTRSILDLADEPERSADLLRHAAGLFREFFEETWRQVPVYCGGYFDAQYSLWAPGPIIRMQEDASAVYSPALYRKFVQPVDRMLASHFAGSFIHLHSTSMFLLDAFLEIGEIRCFEINQDALGPPLRRMIPHFRKVQEAGKPLLIRGSFTPEEARILMDCLDPRGLFLYIMVENMKQIELLRPILGM